MQLETILRSHASSRSGSRVRGDFSGESDLDLLVLLDDISAKEDVIRFIFRIEREGVVIYDSLPR